MSAGMGEALSGPVRVSQRAFPIEGFEAGKRFVGPFCGNFVGVCLAIGDEVLMREIDPQSGFCNADFWSSQPYIVPLSAHPVA